MASLPSSQGDNNTTSGAAAALKASELLTVEAGDVLRLVQAHLTENGLHESCRALREESGVLAAGACHHNYRVWAMQGKWGSILESLSTMDTTRISAELVADVHEMAILELGDVGETELAHAALRLVVDELDVVTRKGQPHTTSALQEQARYQHDPIMIPRSRLLEQKLAALVSYRASSSSQLKSRSSATTPPDYYGERTQKARREEIGKRLGEYVPVVPSSRLISLLQQSIKWQAHTGLFPTTVQQEHFQEEDDEIEEEEKETQPDHKKKKKKKRKRKRKEFNLVLGEVNATSAVVGEAAPDSEDIASSTNTVAESIPSRPYSSVKFGKKNTAESAVFLPDASGLVTGSSDGLIEIWDPLERFSKLRLDLDYQNNDEFMWHDKPVLSLAVSNDCEMLASGDLEGNVKVWKISTGKCLREFRAHEKAVSCLSFSNDGSHVLTGSHDGTVREFGLRTARMLKEFRGHGSYVNTCCYHVVNNDRLFVLTGSSDGTVRVWDGKSAETLRVLKPRAGVASSVVDSLGGTANHSSASGEGVADSPSIHSVIPFLKIPNVFLVVPRGPKAFLINQEGAVLRDFDTGEGKVLVSATISPSNQWIYAVAEDGGCFIFDAVTGQVEQSIRNFAMESTNTISRNGDGKEQSAEISALLHHPHKGLLAAFSNDKGQKRGTLTLWK